MRNAHRNFGKILLVKLLVLFIVLVFAMPIQAQNNSYINPF